MAIISIENYRTGLVWDKFMRISHVRNALAKIGFPIEENVVNQPPVAIISAVPISGSAPLTVNFSGFGSYDPDSDDTLTYLWNFGDWNTSNEQNPTHTYQKAGNYIAILTVTDNHGTSDIASVTVAVSEATETATIKGRVTDAGNLDNPIEGALIKIKESPFMVTQSSQSNNIYTDSEGYYSMEIQVPKPRTRFLVKASRSGYDSQIEQTPAISAGKTVTVNLSLKKLEQQNYIPGEILVRVRGDILPSEVLSICDRYGAYEVDDSRARRGRFLIIFKDSQVNLDKIILELGKLPEVKYAIKNYMFIIK